MKVLYCGGFGVRMRDGVTTGSRPVALVQEGTLLRHVIGDHAHCPAAVITAPGRP
jgi:hypothetical protein